MIRSFVFDCRLPWNYQACAKALMMQTQINRSSIKTAESITWRNGVGRNNQLPGVTIMRIMSVMQANKQLAYTMMAYGRERAKYPSAPSNGAVHYLWL